MAVNPEEETFQGPIPGQFATDTPGANPYDRPPELTDPRQTLQKVWENLTKPEVAMEVVRIMDQGVTVDTLVNSLLQSMYGEGKVHISVLPLIAPSLGEMLVYMASKAGVTPRFRGDPSGKTQLSDIQEEDLEGFEDELETLLNAEAAGMLDDVNVAEEGEVEEDFLLEEEEDIGGIMSRPETEEVV